MSNLFSEPKGLMSPANGSGNTYPGDEPLTLNGCKDRRSPVPTSVQSLRGPNYPQF